MTAPTGTRSLQKITEQDVGKQINQLFSSEKCLGMVLTTSQSSACKHAKENMDANTSSLRCLYGNMEVLLFTLPVRKKGNSGGTNEYLKKKHS